MIRIGVVDDQTIVRSGLVQLIQISAQHEVLFEASHGKDALEKLSTNTIDLLITDIKMPVMNGIELISAIRKTGSKVPVLVLTTFDDNELLMQAIKEGANGFLLKDVDLEKLNLAISALASGEYLFEPQILSGTPSSAEDSTMQIDPLSDTEKQVLRFAAAGFSNRDIASNMHLAEGTIKNYVSKILEKTQSRDRTQAVVKAIHWKLI